MSVSGIGKSPSKVYAGDTSNMRLTLHKTMLIQLKFEACENIFLIKWFCVALVDASYTHSCPVPVYLCIQDGVTWNLSDQYFVWLSPWV